MNVFPPMHFKSSFGYCFTTLQWAFVVYLLLAPRIVGHRHCDLSQIDCSNQRLATHLERCHGFTQTPIDANQFHFHLSFSTLPADIPNSLTIHGAGILDIAASRSCDYLSKTFPQLAFIQPMRNGTNDPLELRSLRFVDCDITTPVNFRRVCFGVWII